MTRSLGHIPDAAEYVSADLLHRNAVELVRGVALPREVDLRHLFQPVEDQGDRGACVGFAVGAAIEAMGYPGRCSKLALYTGARAVETPYPMVIYDEGCMPRLLLRALMDPAGSCLVPEDVWPYSERVDLRLPLDVYQHADGASIDYHRIGAADRVTTVQAALAMGRPVPFAMEVDQAYEDNAGELYTGPRGKSLGSHMQCIVGYGPNGFLVRNSWGTGWGSSGYAWVASPVVASAQCSDFYVITRVPR